VNAVRACIRRGRGGGRRRNDHLRGVQGRHHHTRHSGQVSLYKGLCETVGLLMAVPSPGRQVAVVPRTEATYKLALRLAPRCTAAGIEIALVGSRVQIFDVPAGGAQS
jgi:hypothetical protein